MGINDIWLLLLNDLPFKDTLVGETHPLKRNLKGKTIVEKIYPVAINTPTTCEVSRYMDLVPNGKKKSIIYFEKSNTRVLDLDRSYFYIAENWRLVCWMNIKIINKNYTDLYPFIHTVMRRIPEEYGNYGNWIDVYFEYKGQVPSEQIFSKYTYDEAEKQYLIYPFGAFALDYEVRYRIAKICLEDVTLDPDLC